MAQQFKELYDYCQTLEIKVSRNQIIGKIKEITGSSVKALKTNLDTNVVRGYFLSASNLEHPLVRQNGCNIIVLAQQMNECWDRFIIVKEAMHLLDENGECTDSAEKFEELISTWIYPNPSIENSSPERRSDVTAMVMALACFCPENTRQEFLKQKQEGTIDDYNIALRLKIPQIYVNVLLASDFLQTVQSRFPDKNA